MVNDIMLNEERDVLIQNGDFVIAPSDAAHIEHLLLAWKGNYREFPLCGVGVARYLNASYNIESRAELKRDIQLQMQVDGYRKIEIDIKSFDNIRIDGSR